MDWRRLHNTNDFNRFFCNNYRANARTLQTRPYSESENGKAKTVFYWIMMDLNKALGICEHVLWPALCESRYLQANEVEKNSENLQNIVWAHRAFSDDDRHSTNLIWNWNGIVLNQFWKWYCIAKCISSYKLGFCIRSCWTIIIGLFIYVTISPPDTWNFYNSLFCILHEFE